MKDRPPETAPLADPPGVSDDDIPTIGDDMLHPEVDFEAGMSALPPMSLAIMLACATAFAVEAARGALWDLPLMVHIGALSRPEVEAGATWRMLSYAFLHANIGHLIGNLVILYIVGMACEHAFGRLQFLTLYVVAGVVGAACSLFGGKVSIGASGAIFGLVGAIVTTLWRHRSRLHVRDRRIGVVLAIWSAYQIALGFLNPEVDNLAHVGGFYAGALLGLVLRPAVLEGRAEVASRPTTIAGFVVASAALIATAAVFVPRLIG